MAAELYADDAIAMFRRIYPEQEVQIRSASKETDNQFIVHAVFPDGDFWFVVNNNSVSASYDSRAKAKAAIGR